MKDGSGLEISAEIDGGNASKLRCLAPGHFSLMPQTNKRHSVKVFRTMVRAYLRAVGTH